MDHIPDRVFAHVPAPMGGLALAVVLVAVLALATSGTADAGTGAPLVHTPAGAWVVATGPLGEPALLADPEPTWVVADDVVDRYGLEPVERGLRAFDDVPGSGLRLDVAVGGRSADHGVARDGTNRVVLAPLCSRGGERILGRVHRHPAPGGGALVGEVDISLCPELSPGKPALVAAVVRHELGHALGLAHLHQPSQEGWRPGTGDSNVCRYMYASVHLCQTFGPDERELAAQLYPSSGIVRPSRPARSTASR